MLIYIRRAPVDLSSLASETGRAERGSREPAPCVGRGPPQLLCWAGAGRTHHVRDMDNRHDEKCGTPCATSHEEMKVRGKDKRKRKRSRSRSSSISSTSSASTTTTSSSCSSSRSSSSSSSRSSSSGRDVSLRATSYAPAERLHQIRRRTRRSKEDIFRELLQSTDAADSESRAWRETINEKLRMDSQERRQGQERMIKLMEDQTEMLRSLIALQAEHIRAQLPL
ncbi:pinin-like isoform X2 [Gopherus evgoodei]|uniref:pinin-like isoform X2 n=1 Tax=Gopherus evgoodei TaxID=1825980 RepID=UPI0011CFFC06|nr:pinin-like isoform X2 [Gopherus evgoodei]